MTLWPRDTSLDGTSSVVVYSDALPARVGGEERQPMTNHLKDKRILIVEDERMIAEVLGSQITDEGGRVIGPVETVAAGLDAIANTALDAVVLDIKLRDGRAYPVADALVARNIPFLFLTGYGADDVPPRHATVVRIEKPVLPTTICRRLETLLAAPSITSSVP
jgi:CheY-like chemotaxis protein